MADAGDVKNGGPAKALSAAEVGTLWNAERRALRIYAVAVTLLAAALGITHFIGRGTEASLVAMLVALGFMLAALAIQFRIRCPRCNARLATQSMLVLPERCTKCDVGIAHPRGLDSELDA